MKKIMPLLPLLFIACGFIVPTPNDFPPPPPTYLTGVAQMPPATVIVEFPQTTVTPTPEMQSLTLSAGDLEDARTFLLIIRTQIAAGDTYGFTEKIHYPIQVNVNGEWWIISTRNGFIANLNSILNDKVLEALSNLDENALAITPEGIRAGNGLLVLNLFCVNTACADKEFLITQIHN